jgi:hypothetical protein
MTMSPRKNVGADTNRQVIVRTDCRQAIGRKPAELWVHSRVKWNARDWSDGKPKRAAELGKMSFVILAHAPSGEC